ncbi:MAG: GspMb/PilO family protein, partial [Planctomycetota bacterium]
VVNGATTRRSAANSAARTTAFAEVKDQTRSLEAELTETRAMIRSRRKIERRWTAVRLAGLADAADAARLRLQVSVSAWARDSGLSLNTLSTGRAQEGETYDRLGFSLVGVGSLESIQKFLIAVDRAEFALRIDGCTITARNDGRDELTLSLKLSTIVRPDTPDTDAPNPGVSP